MTTGCLHRQARKTAAAEAAQAEACPAAGRGSRCSIARKPAKQPVADPGPQVGAVAYPYYNLRGPRDFLERNPQSIGP